jgi:hypothetical protein
MSSKQSVIRKSAILAADWYVNSQLPLRPGGSDWDANAGRFIYNYHIPTRWRVNGLPWTQARAIMVLMAAYRLTGKSKYMEAAKKGAGYLFTTQEVDQTRPYFGTFHEEVPQSDKCWPRDGAEAASGYLHLYHETGDKDLVRRCKLYADWLLSVSDKKDGFPPGGSYFNPVRQHFYRKAFLVGTGMMYGLLYRATGEKKYLEKGLRPLAVSVEKHFLGKDGALIETHFDPHHTRADKTGRLLVLNDDGLCAALLSYGKITNQPKLIEQAVRIADWMMTLGKVDQFSSLPGQLNFILDIHRETGEKKYHDYVLKRLPEVLALQVTGSKDPWAQGGFRGEDELPKWYVKGARNKDFVLNRVTAYSALCLFKLLNGTEWTPGYSAFGWKRKPVKA